MFVLGSTKLYAGWYECYNFKGTIANYPITLSLQVRQGFFGEKDKKDFNLLGVYKYDKHNKPIKLEGKLQGQKVLLYELDSNKYTAIFSFTLTETECNGIWTNELSKNKLNVHLTFISKLVDTSESTQFKNIEILQSNSLKDYYFIGIYSKISGADHTKMNKLTIRKKTDSSIFQTLDFSKVESETGNVMTIIYDNVEITNSKTNEFTISNREGRIGSYLIVKYSKKNKRFKLDTTPYSN